MDQGNCRREFTIISMGTLIQEPISSQRVSWILIPSSRSLGHHWYLALSPCDDADLLPDDCTGITTLGIVLTAKGAYQHGTSLEILRPLSHLGQLRDGIYPRSFQGFHGFKGMRI